LVHSLAEKREERAFLEEMGWRSGVTYFGWDHCFERMFCAGLLLECPTFSTKESSQIKKRIMGVVECNALSVPLIGVLFLS